MANTTQARKRAQQADQRREHNAAQRTRVRSALRKVEKMLDSGDHAAAEQALREAVPVVDRMADRGIVPKNAASRYKSRLNARLKKLATA